MYNVHVELYEPTLCKPFRKAYSRLIDTRKWPSFIQVVDDIVSPVEEFLFIFFVSKSP